MRICVWHIKMTDNERKYSLNVWHWKFIFHSMLDVQRSMFIFQSFLRPIFCSPAPVGYLLRIDRIYSLVILKIIFAWIAGRISQKYLK